MEVVIVSIGGMVLVVALFLFWMMYRALARSQRTLQELVVQQHTTTLLSVEETLSQERATTMQQVQQELTHTQHLVQQQLQSVTQQIQNSLLHVQQETTTLSRALRSTNQQGYWGELQLLQALKLAGMQEHCDFEAQKTFPTLKGVDRPDVVIQLHGERLIVIDAKAPLGSYLDAVAATTDPEVKNHMVKYTQTVRGHIRDLAKKEYWHHASCSPEFVILYLPTEAMYRAALEHDAKLFDYGMDYKVLIASPMSLLALLKVIAFGWNQEARTQNVQQILEHGQRVRRSLVQFCDQWQILRKSLDETIKAFNQVAMSYSQTVLPDLEELRRLDEMYKNTKPVELLKVLRRQIEIVDLLPEQTTELSQ